MSGLAERVGNTTFEAGSALDMPYPDASFDGGIAVYAAMNINDRERLHAEIARILKFGASFGIYDMMKGNTEPLNYPVPWAMTPETSFVATPDETHALLQSAGFEILDYEGRTAVATAYFESVAVAAKQADALPPIGQHLLLGTNHAVKRSNLQNAVRDDRLVPAIIVARKSKL